MIGADAIRGHIDLILLAILETGPSYAYEISKTITDRSRGEYVIKQTTLYTAVKRLQAQGLLAGHEDISPSGKPRTYYALTADGLEQLELKRAEWRSTRALVDHFAAGKDIP
ncbi:PadR family transcriptional regulator [Brachybacterium saurashtrense]|uniref:PadR family transcriptional regulator n=1 Tax=Brachybacterium saurashtrense TaxID=556288 RepID=A0A345YPQ8_9MICO|nr:PadR family transcriptional regulator [Brachybacterium saurashtrense]AXK45910.1 PadR family transcriptional regulator [Brachybacterium saurashtrense]RRR23648.1 PadR family transcriptional regulator [Brachybacterium saurashtrense]